MDDTSPEDAEEMVKSHLLEGNFQKSRKQILGRPYTFLMSFSLEIVQVGFSILEMYASLT